MDPSLAIRDEGLVAAHWHNVVLIDLKEGMRLAHLPKLEALYQKLIASYPKHGAVNITWMGSTVNAQRSESGEVRAESSKMFKRLGNVRRVAVVIEESGLMFSLLSTLLRSINTMSRNASTMVVYKSLDDAVVDIVPLVAHAVTRADVSEAMNAVRRGQFAR